jgi:hypothetical protein
MIKTAFNWWGRRPKSVKRAVVNTSSDTGAWFEIGNSSLGFVVSPVAGFVSLGMVSVAMAFRYAAERGDFARDVPVLGVVLKNQGNGMIASGVGLGVASFFAFRDGGVILSEQAIRENLESIWQAGRTGIVLGSFAFANTIRGAARFFDDGSKAQRAMDCVSMWSATFGVTLAAPEVDVCRVECINSSLDVLRYGTFGAAATIETRNACLYQRVKNPMSGNLIYAVGCLQNMLFAPGTLAKGANACFAFAYYSLDALIKYRGLYQQFESSKKNKDIVPHEQGPVLGG